MTTYQSFRRALMLSSGVFIIYVLIELVTGSTLGQAIVQAFLSTIGIFIGFFLGLKFLHNNKNLRMIVLLSLAGIAIVLFIILYVF